MYSSSNKASLAKRFYQCRALYVFLLPAVVLCFVFSYIPIYGAQIAFRDFTPARGVWGSEWVGLKWFEQFLNSYQFKNTFRNTLRISIYSLVVSFPLPILLALVCNQMKALGFKRFFQTGTYLPHFISTVVVCGMINLFFSPSVGVISKIVALFGIKMPNLLASAKVFPSIYVWSGVWQNLGFDSIMYVAALSAIDPTLYESATLDGATKLQKMRYIDLPLIMPTCTIMLILRAGSLVSVGFEKVYLLQNALNLSTSEVLSTYIYKMGMVNNQYGLSAAVNIFNNVINLVLLLSVNFIAGKLNDTKLI